MKEVKMRRVAGPFESIPFEHYIQSLIGPVLKTGKDQTRLIFHLSYDFGKKECEKSVNHFIPVHKCTVHYNDVDAAVKAYLNLASKFREMEAKFVSEGEEEHCFIIFTGKTDLKSAFRILCMSRSSWPWLAMKATDPKSGIVKYFIDKCLPFDASISCALFQRFSNALCHLMEWQTQSLRKSITNYLDDFLFIALTILRCNFLIDQFIELYEQLGVPISLEKTERASVRVVFLGLLLDGAALSLSIPLEKRQKAQELLEKFILKKKAMVKELQTLCGYLNFISRMR